MAGIVFLKTKRLADVVRFYCEQVGMNVWLEQADCTILQHGNLLVGFCQRDTADTGGIITFYYPTRADVDQMYEKFRPAGATSPQQNNKYRIYHFFAEDPEDRTIEFQTFLDPVPSV